MRPPLAVGLPLPIGACPVYPHYIKGIRERKRVGGVAPAIVAGILAVDATGPARALPSGAALVYYHCTWCPRGRKPSPGAWRPRLSSVYSC